jgi:hypothetical protein
MKNYLIGLLIALVAGIGLLLFFNQGLFTDANGVTEPADDVFNIGDDTLAPAEEESAGTEEEVVVDAPEEEATVEVSEPDGGEGQNTDDDAGFTITNFPYQDFIQARSKGEPIVLKFYSET